MKHTNYTNYKMSVFELEPEEFYMGISSEKVLEFKRHGAQGCVGRAWLNQILGNDDVWYLEYVEIFTGLQGKGFFRSVLAAAMDFVGAKRIEFACEEKHLKKYTHLGAVVNSYDEDEEMYYLYLEKSIIQNGVEAEDAFRGIA